MRAVLSSVFLALAAVLLSPGPVCAQIDTSRVRIAHPEIADSSTKRFIEVFRQGAQERGLSVDAIPYPGAAAAEVLLALKNGAFPADVALLPLSSLPELDTSPSLTYTSLIAQPGLINDATEGFLVQDSYIGDSVAAELAQTGLSVVSFWNRPSNAIAFSRRIETSEELAGAKVISSNPASFGLLEKLGASPVSMPFAEIYTALEAGVADGAEGNKTFLLEAGFLGQIKGGTVVDNYIQNPGFLVSNREQWLTLPQRTRSAIQSSAEEAREASQGLILEGEKILASTAQEFDVFYASVGLAGWQAVEKVAAASWVEGGTDSRRDAYTELQAVKEDIRVRQGRGGSLDAAPALPDIMFATNRNDEGGHNLAERFGIAKSGTNPLSCGRIGYDTAIKRSFGDAQTGPLTLRDGEIVVGAEDCADMVGRLADRSGRVTIFFHGYWNSFESAVRRTIGVAQDFHLMDPVVAWSWPSAGSMGEYLFDLNSVEYTRRYIRQFVDALDTRGLLGDVTIVAHSMGSKVAGYFLEATHAKGKQVANVVFVAADYPASIFTQMIDDYGPAAKLRTLYANQYDRALAISRAQSREVPVGLGGTYLTLVRDVETVDVSSVARNFGSNHAHAFDIEPVAQDASRLIVDRIGADGRRLPSVDLNGRRYWKIN